MKAYILICCIYWKEWEDQNYFTDADADDSDDDDDYDPDSDDSLPKLC